MSQAQPRHILSAASRVSIMSLLFAGGAAMVYLAPVDASRLVYHWECAHELWRVMSCHWVHWNLDHFLWSVGVFVVLGTLCEREGRGRFLTCLVTASLAIPAALWAFAPALPTYGGLSGIDSALFVLVAVRLLGEKFRTREWFWLAASGALLLAFLAKVGFEFATSTTVFVSHRVTLTPVPLAHIVGGAVGALVSVPWSPLVTRAVRRTAKCQPCILIPSPCQARYSLATSPSRASSSISGSTP